MREIREDQFEGSEFQKDQIIAYDYVNCGKADLWDELNIMRKVSFLCGNVTVVIQECKPTNAQEKIGGPLEESKFDIFLKKTDPKTGEKLRDVHLNKILPKGVFISAQAEVPHEYTTAYFTDETRTTRQAAEIRFPREFHSQGFIFKMLYQIGCSREQSQWDKYDFVKGETENVVDKPTTNIKIKQKRDGLNFAMRMYRELKIRQFKIIGNPREFVRSELLIPEVNGFLQMTGRRRQPMGYLQERSIRLEKARFGLDQYGEMHWITLFKNRICSEGTFELPEAKKIPSSKKIYLQRFYKYIQAADFAQGIKKPLYF
jgi:hypothetical protein